MKKISASLCSLICCVLLMGAAIPPPQVVATKGFYINDYASMLFSSHRRDILSVSSALWEQTGIQVVVLTVDSFNQLSPQLYAQSIIQGWEIGGPGGKDGVLILVSKEDRSSVVMVGGNLAYLDSFCAAEVKVADNNVSKAIMNVYRPLVWEIFSISGILPDQAIQKILDNPTPQNPGPHSATSTILLAGIFVVLGRSIWVTRKYQNRFKGTVRKIRTYSRSQNEEDQYKDQGGEDLYTIKHDGMD